MKKGVGGRLIETEFSTSEMEWPGVRHSIATSKSPRFGPDRIPQFGSGTDGHHAFFEDFVFDREWGSLAPLSKDLTRILAMVGRSVFSPL